MQIKTQEQWRQEYDNGEITLMDLWDAGFRPRSNRYKSIVKEFKYHKKFYSIELTLTKDEYSEFKESEFIKEQIKYEKEQEVRRTKEKIMNLYFLTIDNATCIDDIKEILKMLIQKNLHFRKEKV